MLVHDKPSGILGAPFSSGWLSSGFLGFLDPAIDEGVVPQNPDVVNDAFGRTRESR